MLGYIERHYFRFFFLIRPNKSVISCHRIDGKAEFYYEDLAAAKRYNKRFYMNSEYVTIFYIRKENKKEYKLMKQDII